MTVPACLSTLFHHGEAAGVPTDTGWVICGTGSADASIGTVGYLGTHTKINDDDTPDDAVSSNLLANWVSYYLVGTNFGFAIPGGATITGIEARYIARTNNAGRPQTLTTIKIKKADASFGSENKGDSASTADTFSNHDYGGDGHEWGETWTPGDINDVDFGVAFSVTGYSSSNSIRVAAIYIKVYYTA